MLAASRLPGTPDALWHVELKMSRYLFQLTGVSAVPPDVLRRKKQDCLILVCLSRGQARRVLAWIFLATR